MFLSDFLKRNVSVANVHAATARGRGLNTGEMKEKQEGRSGVNGSQKQLAFRYSCSERFLLEREQSVFPVSFFPHRGGKVWGSSLA